MLKEVRRSSRTMAIHTINSVRSRHYAGRVTLNRAAIKLVSSLLITTVNVLSIANPTTTLPLTCQSALEAAVGAFDIKSSTAALR